MSFLSPLFLAGALAAAVPIVLHLLKREPETAREILRGAACCGTRRSSTPSRAGCASCCCWRCGWRRCCCWRSPSRGRSSRRRRAAGAGVTIIALDTSLSMSAPGRFERAKQLARRGDRPRAGRRSGRGRRRLRTRRRSRRSRRAIAARARRGDRQRARPAPARPAIAPALNAAVRPAARPARRRWSSSPICRRPGGTRATARRFPSRRGSRSPTSARRRRIWR